MKVVKFSQTYASLSDAFSYFKSRPSAYLNIKPIDFIKLLNPDHSDAEFSSWILPKSDYDFIRLMAVSTKIVNVEDFIDNLLDHHLI